MADWREFARDLAVLVRLLRRLAEGRGSLDLLEATEGASVTSK
jgi:hypothetical protein